MLHRAPQKVMKGFSRGIIEYRLKQMHELLEYFSMFNSFINHYCIFIQYECFSFANILYNYIIGTIVCHLMLDIKIIFNLIEPAISLDEIKLFKCC